MAKITITNSIFDLRDITLRDVHGGKSIKDILYELDVDKRNYSNAVEIYDPERDITTFEYIDDDENENILATIFVNNENKDIDYIIKETDVIIVQIFPADKKGGGIAMIIGGAALAVAGLIVSCMSFGLATPIGMLLMAGGSLLIGSGIGLLNSPDISSSEDKKKGTDDNGEQNPTISGAQNTSIINNSYPLVLGEINVNPFIVGQLYTEIYGTYGEKQKAYLLLAVGYAPLYIDNIKFNSLPVASNSRHVIAGRLSKSLNGTITPYIDKSKATTDIGTTWDNNNIDIEISQLGYINTLYPYAVKQEDVNATLLYCYDKKYQEIAGTQNISWMGATFPTGMRTETIHFSGSVPRKITVGIDIPQGLYREYTNSDGKFCYTKIPMNLIIQWRPRYKYIENGGDTSSNINQSSNYVYDNKTRKYDEKRYSGWRDFDNPDFVYLGAYLYNMKVYNYGGKIAKRGDYLGYYSYTSYDKYDFKLEGTFIAQSQNAYTEANINRLEAEYYPKKKENYYWEERKEVTQEIRQNKTLTGWRIFLGIITLGISEVVVYVTKVVITVHRTLTRDQEAEAHRFARRDAEKDLKDAEAAHANKANEAIRQGDVKTHAMREIMTNFGISESSSLEANPSWTGHPCFSLGKYSCKTQAKATGSHTVTKIKTEVIEVEGKAKDGSYTRCETHKRSKNNGGGHHTVYYHNEYKQTSYTETEEETLDTDPSLNNNESTFKLTNPDGPKDEMRFEFSAEIDRETILDLLNRNPKTIAYNKASVEDEPGQCVIDSLEVRVLRLTPCYINKVVDSNFIKAKKKVLTDSGFTEAEFKSTFDEWDKMASDKVSVNYSDVVKWAYIKTDLMDKDALLHDIDTDYEDADGNITRIIDCREDSYEKAKTWNTWDIDKYRQKTIRQEDADKLVTIGISLEPDKLGYISNSIDKVSVTAHAITPALRTEYIRYWRITSGSYFYYDSYDTEKTMDWENFGYASSPIDKWQPCTKEEFDSFSKTSLGSDFYYTVINSSDYPWLVKFYPEKIEKTVSDELALDANGDRIYNDEGMPIIEEIPKGNSWIRYIKDEIQRYTSHHDVDVKTVSKNSIFSAITTSISMWQQLFGTSGNSSTTPTVISWDDWIASPAFLDTFIGQNAIGQAIGLLTGQGLGKYAYQYNFSNSEKYVRLWYKPVTGPQSLFLYYDTDDIEFNNGDIPSLPEFPKESDFANNASYQYHMELFYLGYIKNSKWKMTNDTAFNAAEPTFVKTITNAYGSFNIYWSYRTVRSDFNPLLLREAWQYTDSINIGSKNGDVKYKFNALISQQQKAETLFAQILFAGRAFWTYDELGRYAIYNDKVRNNPIMLITDENVMSSQNTRAFMSQISGYHITFSDETNSYKPGEIYVMVKGESKQNHKRDIKDLSLQGVTNVKQAQDLGIFLLAQNITTREVWTRKLWRAGMSLTIGSMVELQSSSLEIGTDHSGRILKLIEDNDYIYGFICDQLYEYKADYYEETDNDVVAGHRTVGQNRQGCSIMQAGANDDSRIVTLRFASKSQQEEGITVEKDVFANLEGETNLVLFEKRIIKDVKRIDEQLDNPQEGTIATQYLPKVEDIVAFGNIGSITSKAIVADITPDEKGHVSVTFYPYYESVYTAGEKYPVYETNLTRPKRDTSIPVDTSVSVVDMNEAANVAISKANDLVNGVNYASEESPEPDGVDLLKASPDQNGILIWWQHNSTGLKNVIDKFVIRIYKNSIDYENNIYTEEETSDMSYKYLWNRNRDGYPEREIVNQYIITVTAVNRYGKSSGAATLLGDNFQNLASYGTWVPSVPEFTKKEADEGGINFEWATPQGSNGRTLYGTNVYQAVVFYDNKERGVIKTENRNGIYNFNRLVDGYPEKPTVKGASVTLNKYTVQLTVINESGSAVQGTQKTIDFENYKTWIPYNLTGADYKPTSNASKRAATLLIPSQAQDVYGNVIFGVTISRRETDKDASNNLIFYTPDIEADCYSDIDSYKADSFDYVFFGGTFKQNLPLLGQDMLSIQVDRKDADFEWKKNTNQETGEIEFILEESEPYANTREYYTISDDGKNEFIRRYKNQIENFDSVLKQIESLEKDNYNNFVSVEWKLAESDFDSEHKNHIQRYATFRKISTPTPRDTEYVYRVIARNMFGNGQSEPYDINLTATANTVSDLVDKAITANKLDDQAVTTDKIAAGAITADEIAAVNILAKGASAGNMTAEGLQVPDSGFWAGKQMRYDYNGTDNLPHTYIAAPGEFFVGNNPNHIEDPSDADEYLHFLPARAGKAGQFFLAIKNVVMSSIATLIKGVFRVKNSLNDKDENAFFTVDPTPKTQGNPNGERVTVKGEVFAKTVTATGAVSAASATVTGAVSAASATVTGAVSAKTVTITGTVSADNGYKATLLDTAGNINPDKVVKVWGAVWN